ncbi:MAG: hypothetical protein JXR81_01945 [Candidatus Goldbacteria bacterium]|nr:hypothetical protein [Candidatus Goldiibacteriota bacterium]
MTFIERYLIFLPLIIMFSGFLISVMNAKIMQKAQSAFFAAAGIIAAYAVLYTAGADAVFARFSLSSMSASAACVLLIMAVLSGSKDIKAMFLFMFCVMVSLNTQTPALKAAAFAGAGFALLYASGINRELSAQKAFYSAACVLFLSAGNTVFFQSMGFFFALASSNSALLSNKNGLTEKGAKPEMLMGIYFELITLTALAGLLNPYAIAGALIFFMAVSVYNTITQENRGEFFFAGSVSILFLFMFGILFTKGAGLMLKGAGVYYVLIFAAFALLSRHKDASGNVTQLKFRPDEIVKPALPVIISFLTLAAEIFALSVIFLFPPRNQFLQMAGYVGAALFLVSAVNNLIIILGVISKLNPGFIKNIFISADTFKFLFVSVSFIFILYRGGVL